MVKANIGIIIHFLNLWKSLDMDNGNAIGKNYIKILKYIINNEIDDRKKNIAEDMLNEFRRNR